MKAGLEGSAPENPQDPEHGGGCQRDADHGGAPADDVRRERVAELMQIRCDSGPGHERVLPLLRVFVCLPLSSSWCASASSRSFSRVTEQLLPRVAGATRPTP